MSYSVKKLIAFSYANIVCALLMGGCSYQDASKVKQNVLVYCSEGSPETFNPQLSTSGTTFDASSRTIYNRLVEFTPGSTLLKPALATSWEVSKNGKEYIFNLRKGVKFHRNEWFSPSRDFNADDVIFSFQRQWLKTHPYHDVSKLSYGYFESMGLRGLITKIEKIDEYRVKFTLERSESPFLATIAMDFASILSAEYATTLLEKKMPESIDTHPIGTGPYQLTRYQPDAFIRYQAHPNYWQGEQKLKEIVFAITPSASLRFARMVAGECDVMANPLPVHINVAKQQENMQVLSEPGLNVSYLALNTQKPPFDQAIVRQAINHAINKESIIRTVYQNTATKAKGPIPPNMWAYNNSFPGYEFDPDKARELLEIAGFENGFSMNIWTMSAQRAYNPNAKKMAELIQQDLKQVGINVSISTFEFGTFLYKTQHGEHHSSLMGWISDNGDPDNFFSPLLSCAATLSGTNAAFWCNPRFNQLLQQARSITDIEERKKFYQKAQIIYQQSAPWVPIAHATQHIIINPRVKNFKIIPAGGIYFGDVYLAKNETEKENTDIDRIEKSGDKHD